MVITSNSIVRRAINSRTACNQGDLGKSVAFCVSTLAKYARRLDDLQGRKAQDEEIDKVRKDFQVSVERCKIIFRNVKSASFLSVWRSALPNLDEVARNFPYSGDSYKAIRACEKLEDEEYTITNSRACNARYQVGTKVQSPSGKIGTITSVSPGTDFATVQLDVPPYGEDEWDIGKCRVVRNSIVSMTKSACNALPPRHDTGAWMKILEASPAAQKVLFKIDPSSLCAIVGSRTMRPGEFKVASAPQIPPVTLKNVRSVAYGLIEDDVFKGGTVVDGKTGEKMPVDFWTAVGTKYMNQLNAAKSDYLSKLDRLQKVSVDYVYSAKASAEQDAKDELYRRASLNAETYRYTDVSGALWKAAKTVGKDLVTGLSDHGDVEMITVLKGLDGWGTFSAQEEAKVVSAIGSALSKFGMKVARHGKDSGGGIWIETDKGRFTNSENALNDNNALACNDARHRRELQKEINDLLRNVTKGMFHDQQWLAVRMVADTLRRYGYDVETNGGKYQESGHNKAKIYTIRAEKDGEVFDGSIYCMGAGTVDDPFSKYDISVMW